MTIVNCPRCRDEVTVPARASRGALVRCPLCLEEYLLGEAIELPPALIVIDGSGGLEEEPALAGAGVATAEAELGRDEYRVAGSGLAGSGFDAALEARPSAGAGVSPARPAVKGTRPKRKEKSALGEILKVVLGGVVGCGLALLVLWWVAGRDDFKLGPRIAPYAPWIVPAKFRGSPAAAGGDTADASSPAGTDSAANSNGTPPKANVGRANGGKANAENGTKNETAGLVGDLPTDVPFPNPVNPTQPLTIEDPIGPPVGPTVRVDPKPEFNPSRPPNPAPLNPAEAPTEPGPLELAPAATDKPLPTAADFAKAVVAAADGLSKVIESKGQPNEVRQKRYIDMYQSASDVGRIVTYLSTSDSDLSEHVDTLKTFLTALGSDPGRVLALKSLTSRYLPERKHDEGVLVAAVVEDFQAAGSMFQCTVLAGRKQEGTELIAMPIISATNPQDFCQSGDEILIVGRVVENPKKNIPGYEGDHERVVLYGYSVTAPK